MNCNRCGDEIPVKEDESCWYCIEALCYKCWDALGHCGHPEAAAFNKAIANRKYRFPPPPAQE